MKKFFLVCIALLAMVTSCSNGSGFGHFDSVSVVSWNVQTFFDAVKDGSEYSDFLKNENWNEQAYCNRVERLCSVMIDLNADVYVFQEIENEAVIYDICNSLAGFKWNSGSAWNYACFYKEKGSSIGCAVISKYELIGFTNHNLDVRTGEKGQPELRAIGKVLVNVNGKEFFLFINHWKSKNTGETETEFWRKQQESVLTNLVLECKNENEENAVVICGDFNKDINEFSFVQNETEQNIALKSCFKGSEKSVLVHSPWYNTSGDMITEGGSYFFKNQWEKIDNFFVCGNIKILSFEVCEREPLIKENGEPFAFKTFNNEGYSDHLPIKLIFQF